MSLKKGEKKTSNDLCIKDNSYTHTKSCSEKVELRMGC